MYLEKNRFKGNDRVEVLLTKASTLMCLKALIAFFIGVSLKQISL